MLKECSNEISPIPALVFNESLAWGNVLDEWRQAYVSLVFKKGEKYDAVNYRLVSLTCICCKTLEHILVNNINKHLAFDGKLADCQHDFRSQRSCETQLVQFVQDIISNLDGAVNRGHKQTDLLKQGYRYHKIRKAFSKFYHRHSELIVKYNIGLKTLLQQGISEPIFYGDLVYKFKRIVGKPNFSDQFKKIVKCYIRVGYSLDIMRLSACLVLNPITVYSYGFLFNCTTVGQASDSMTALT